MCGGVVWYRKNTNASVNHSELLMLYNCIAVRSEKANLLDFGWNPFVLQLLHTGHKSCVVHCELLLLR